MKRRVVPVLEVQFWNAFMVCDFPVVDYLYLWDAGDAGEVAEHGLLVLAERFPVAVLFRLGIKGLQCARSSVIVLPLNTDIPSPIHIAVQASDRHCEIARYRANLLSLSDRLKRLHDPHLVEGLLDEMKLFGSEVAWIDTLDFPSEFDKRS